VPVVHVIDAKQWGELAGAVREQRWAPFAHQSEKRFVEVSTAVVGLLAD
jgi:hypothetical protein